MNLFTVIFALCFVAGLAYSLISRRKLQQGENGQTRPVHSLTVFSLVMLFIVLFGPYLQMNFGLWGLAATEVLILVPPLAYAILMKKNLKEVFLLKLPELRHFAGALLLWLGGLIAANSVTLLIMRIFPETMERVEALSNFLSSDNILLGLFAVAIMPAICEEVLHRGLILSAFRDRYSTVKAVLIMGFIFGLFHLDGLRFFGTGILGMVLTYGAIKSRSLLIPVFMHFCNNMLSFLVNHFSGQEGVDTSAALAMPKNTVEFIGYFIGQTFAAAVACLLLWMGYLLLREKTEKRKFSRALGVAMVAIYLTFLGGMVMSLGQMGEQTTPVAQRDGFTINMTFGSMNGRNEGIPVEITRDGILNINFETDAESGQFDFTLYDADKKVLFTQSGRSLQAVQSIPVEKGILTYNMTVSENGKTGDATNGFMKVDAKLE